MAAQTQGAGSKLAGFFTAVVLVHILDTLLGRLGTGTIPDVIFLIVYLVLLPLLGIFGAFRTSSPSENSLKSFLILAGLGAISYVIPYFAYNVLAKAGVSPTLVMTLLVFFPIYPFLLFFTRASDLGKFWAGFMSLYLIFWVLLLVYANPQWFTATSAKTAQYLGDSVPGVKPGALIAYQWDRASKGALLLWQTSSGKSKQFVNESLNFATGDAFTARVDQRAKTKLGVFFSDLTPTQPTFAKSDRVGAFTTITAETLDKPLMLTIDCEGKDNFGNPVPDEAHIITPGEPIEVTQQESVDVDCAFEPNTFSPNSATVTVSASFGMTTLSYLKTYLMNKDRLREMRAANIDPFQQYGITDRNPVAIYTNGPVSVGLGFGTPPIGIDVNADQFSSSLGITLTNKWDGRLVSVNSIALLVPKGLMVADISSPGGTVEQAHCTEFTIEDWCDESISDLFIVKPQLGTALTPGQSATVRLQVVAGPQSYESLLGNSPISARYIKAIADYNYRLEKAVTIPITDIASTQSGGVNEIVRLDGAPFVETSAIQATVKFNTTVAASTKVRYCRGTNMASCVPGEIKISTDVVGKHHTHVLEDLLPTAVYSYELIAYSNACDKGECELNAANYQFTTGSTI